MKKRVQFAHRMKNSSDPIPVILAGGGNVLLPEQLKGTSTVHRPNLV
jgi:hypothetical protein